MQFYFLLLSYDKMLRGKVSDFSVLIGVSGRVDTIKIAAEKWAIEISADVYTDGLASGGLLD